MHNMKHHSRISFFWEYFQVLEFTYYTYLFRQSKLYSYSNKGSTVDTWNFKIQKNVFFIVSFTWRDDIKNTELKNMLLAGACKKP